jgi:transcriptional regulator with XRE-family HTH domain
MSTPTVPESQPAPDAGTTADIDEQVLALLQPRKGEWEQIALRSGVVSYSWISKFANGHIPGPKVDTLRKLRAWLQANPQPLPTATTTDPSLAPADGATSEPQA